MMVIMPPVEFIHHSLSERQHVRRDKRTPKGSGSTINN